MDLRTLILNNPEMKMELIRLQAEAAKDLTDFMKNTPQSNSNSESYTFDRGVKFGRFSILTELSLGVDIQNSMNIKPSIIETVTDAQYTQPREYNPIKNKTYDPAAIAKGIYSEDSLFYPEKTICAHCDNKECFCEEAMNN